MKSTTRKSSKKTGYNFFYNTKDFNVKRKISFSAKGMNLSEVLNGIFANSQVDYVINGTDIVLKRREEVSNVSNEKYQIKGTVRDGNGEPVIGASVVLKGHTETGVITDIDGNFVLTVPAKKVTLSISYIGYDPVNVEATVGTFVKVVMKESSQTLNEVVVVGYGTQKKMNLTGSVATISADNIATIPVSNISNAMAGRMPGIFSYNKSGMPGVSSPITIRGVNTPNNTNPTYVIDGVVREKADFDALDPNTIENISVLKDAASAAVYGSRASNGVIVVSTKRGKNQKPQFSYSGLFGTDRPTRTPEVMNAYDRTVYLNNQFMYNGIPETDSRYYTADEQEYFKNTQYKLVRPRLAKTRFTTQHNLSVNRG